MENYENEELRQEPEYTPPQPRQEDPQPYREQPAAPQTYSYFRRLQDRIVAFVSAHSHISAEAFETLMLKKEDMAADVGSVVYGEEAVGLGLIDRLGGLSDGLECLYEQIGKRKEDPAEH